jgi:tetratricopeptide (TPR) repeat protein
MNLVKQFYLTLMTCTVSLTWGFAQKAALPVKVGTDIINCSVRFAPLDFDMAARKETTGKKVRIPNLRYCHEPELSGLYSAAYHKTSYRYQEDYPEFEFRHTLGGLQKLEVVKDSSIYMGSIPNFYKVYRRVFNVYFPHTLDIYQRVNGAKEPKLVRRIVLDNGRVPRIREAGTTEQGAEFRSSAEIDAIPLSVWYRKYELELVTRAVEEANFVFDALYKPYQNKPSSMICYIKKRKRAYDFADFDKAVEDYKLAMKTRLKETELTDRMSDSLIANCTLTFEKLLNLKEERIDANVKMILHYNLAWCYFWKGDAAKSRMLLEIARPDLIKEDLVDAINYLQAQLKIMEMRLLLKKEQETDVTPFVTY